jgi:CelD/BcsL family acetyltransferase involved in cellulose biosynthesis
MKALNAAFAPSAPGREDPVVAADDVEIACLEANANAVTAQDLAAIDEVYAHLYCSPRYFEAASAYADASLYIARRNGVPVAAFPYKRSGRDINVVSEYMSASDVEINRFARHMFSRHRDVRRIVFPKVVAAAEKLAYPCHGNVCSEDMVVDLPDTVKEYEAATGKSTRRNIKRYTSALVKDFPSYSYELHVESDIAEQDLRDIIALSCMRMHSKNIEPRFQEPEINWIVQFARECGIVGVARIDGKVAAGAIGFRIGDRYFMHVIAHHPQYNDYSLGILCYYHTICEGIARGAKRFHLLQGRYGYKYRLLAQRHDVLHLDVYRDRLQMLASLRDVAAKEMRGRIWLGKQWLLHDLQRQEGRGYRQLEKLVNYLRQAKRGKREQKEQ